MAGHPLALRACGLLSRAQPVCSSLGLSAAGLQQAKAVYKVCRTGGVLHWHGPDILRMRVEVRMVRLACVDPWRLTCAILRLLLFAQVNLCMAPPGMAAAPPPPPPVGAARRAA